jgi:hypothetical protein
MHRVRVLGRIAPSRSKARLKIARRVREPFALVTVFLLTCFLGSPASAQGSFTVEMEAG